MVDVLGNTKTKSVLEIGTSVYGAIEKVGDHDWYKVELEAGKTYEFRLHGMGVDQIDDTYLRLRDAAGSEIASNDESGSSIWDGFNAHDSRIVFTAATSGVYYLDAATYLDVISNQPRDPADATTGDFLLTAVEQNPNGMVFTPDEIAWQLIDNGNALFGDEPAAFHIGKDRSLTVNIAALTTEGQALAIAALKAWTDVTGIKFVQTTGTAEIAFDDANGGGYANPIFADGVITSATINIGTDVLNDFGTGFNSYSYETYIHEIGHAIGFGHGGNYNGTAVYGQDNFYLNDSLAYSIMSYMQTQGDEFSGNIVNTFVDADFRYMLTPAIADIIAIQNLYGDQVQTSTRKGDTTYGFNSNTGNAALDAAVTFGSDMYFCVYDDSGKDRLDFSQATVDQTINLNALAASNVLGGKMNLAIARGTVIESALGGSADDTMIGNKVTNSLSAFGGDDTLRGGGGNDKLLGGIGLDLLNGGTGKDRLTGGADVDLFFFQRGYGRDVITDFDAKGGDGLQDFIQIVEGAKFDIERNGHDTVIDFGKGSTLTLLDVKASQVTEADFVFLNA
ncbi:MAG: Alkaline metalloproteinase [Rhizobium sp.]|nr:Alkaline metalloproteinase [Rhizobium sp.]